MNQDPSNMRISYDRAALNRSELLDNPFDQFSAWFEMASAETLEPNAMTLCTVSDNVPSARMVLLKGIDHGFKFYTNHDSQKGQEIAGNPNVALVFYWDVLHKQIRITGRAEKMSAEASLPYYHSRPRGSQIGAWTSPQSTTLENRELLEQRSAEFKAKFADTDPLPIPPYWGGYRVVPHTIEFWQGRQSRLHDRFRYTQQADGSWLIERLAP